VPLKGIKGQIVADFLIDHSSIEILEFYMGTNPWVLYLDGSKHVNGVGIDVVLISPNNTLVKILLKSNFYVPTMKHNMRL